MQPGNIRSKLKAERIQDKLKAERIQSKLEVPRLEELLAEVPGWAVGEDGRSLRRVYELPTLRAAGLFVQLATEIGEAAGQVPDVDLRYLEVTLTVAGPANDGIAETDFQLARMLDGRV
jgi:pterin-4a-carbinolamine dehydratase